MARTEAPVYVPIVLPIEKPLCESDKEELITYRNWFLASIEPRLEMLRRQTAFASEGDARSLDYSEESLHGVDRWLRANIQLRDRSQPELRAIQACLRFPVVPSAATLDERSLSFCFDAAIYLGEAIRRACDGARWHQDRSSRQFVDFGHMLVTRGGKAALNPLRVVVNTVAAVASRSAPERRLPSLYRTWSGLL